MPRWCINALCKFLSTPGAAAASVFACEGCGWAHWLAVLCQRLTFFFFFIFRLVSGAGDIKITKDGNILLHEMVSSCGGKVADYGVFI